VFLDSDNVCFAYSSTEYALFSISKLTTLDVTTPIPASISMGAFSGLSGYMTLGLGAKAKPGLVRLSDTEALIVKDSMLQVLYSIQWKAEASDRSRVYHRH
jgi:hypothetical protein